MVNMRYWDVFLLWVVYRCVCHFWLIFLVYFWVDFVFFCWISWNSKSDIKLTRTRIEMIKKKRNATQKYLRNDIADLLKNGLDINAYGRVKFLSFFLIFFVFCFYLFCSEFLHYVSLILSFRSLQSFGPEIPLHHSCFLILESSCILIGKSS